MTTLENRPAKARTPLTESQKSDANRLNAAWIQWKADRKAAKLPYSQEWVGQQFDPPISQGAVWQYIKGNIALNVSAVAEFSRIFEISAGEISPSHSKIMLKAAAQVSQSSNNLLSQLDRHVKSSVTNTAGSLTTSLPGNVFSWEEVCEMIRDELRNLPEVFNVEVPDDALVGYAKTGDSVTLNRALREAPKAGDGILVESKGPGKPFIALRLYRPKGDGTFTAAATHPDFEPLKSVQDQLVIIAVVTGMPSCRWSSR